MRRAILLALIAGLSSSLACSDRSKGVVEIDAEGAVLGVVWLDRNGNGLLDSSDGPVRQVTVRFFDGAAATPSYTGRSNGSGEFTIGGMAVGDYRVGVDSATAGDSIRVLRIDSARITVGQADTAIVTVGFTYPTVSVDSARRLPTDTRLFVEGKALNSWAAFADSTVHIRDTTGAVRAVRLPPVGITAGDSIRVQGVMSLRAGQPVLRNGPLFVIRTGVESPPPDTVTAALAATADAGRLDADLVHLDSVVVQDTTTNALGETVVTVEDGSGTVDVLFDRDIPFSLSFQTDVIGTILEVTGLLIPSGSPGRWYVKPRENQDVVVGPLSYPILTVAEARAEALSTRIQLEGLALNAWNAFGDSTLHLRDATGAIRSLRVRPVAIAAGDSIRLLGTTAALNAQVVLRDVRTTLLEKGLASPAPDTITADQATRADGGVLDADLVRLDSVVIQDTTRNALNELVFVVEDGSGTARVVLDRNVPFPLSFPTDVIGTILEVTGILVPTSNGAEWTVKPRTANDITVGPLSYPTLSIAEARQQPAETRVIVGGLAVTAWNAFGDSTLHVADTTGTIRALRVNPVAVASGDSLRVVGTLTTAFGQPVLRDTRVERIRTGVVSPPADSVATGTAANADTGQKDAALVRIAGAVVQDTARTADTDFVLVVDDGSGPVNVVLDREVAFFLDATTIIGATIKATGVLVPSSGSAGTWVLKPRRNQDLVVN